MAAEDVYQTSQERSLQNGIASQFNNPSSFPDLTLTLGSERWLCHRSIICMQSRYFLKLCTGSFKEGGASEIELKHHDCHALEAALEFCYTAKLSYEDSSAIEADVNSAIFYVRVYAASEMLFLPGLRELAAEGFTKVVTSSALTPQQLVEVIKEVYDDNKTPDWNRVLRDTVVAKVVKHSTAYVDSNMLCFEELMAHQSDFTLDLAKALAKSMSQKRSVHHTYQCPDSSCTHTYKDPEIAKGEDTVMHKKWCPRRRVEYDLSGAHWRLFRIESEA